MDNNEQIKFKIDLRIFKPIIADKTIPSGAKVVLYNLYFRLGGKNYSFPSQKTIAEEVGLCERQVRNHIKLLKEKVGLGVKRGIYNPKTKKFAKVNVYDLSNILEEVII